MPLAIIAIVAAAGLGFSLGRLSARRTAARLHDELSRSAEGRERLEERESAEASRAAAAEARLAELSERLSGLDAELRRLVALHGQIYARAPLHDRLLALVADKSEAAAFALMDEVGAISSRLSATLAEANGFQKKLEAEGSVGEIVASAREAAGGEMKSAEELLRSSKDIVAATRRMRELVEGSMGMLKDIEDVSERSRLIAFNLAVEAARIGRHGLGIKVIVNELSHINDKIIEFSKTAAARLAENRDLGVRIADEVERGIAEVAARIHEGSAASERALERLIAGAEGMGRLVASLSSAFAEARDSVDAMLVSLQFQDITRQQLETVRWSLSDAAERQRAAVGDDELRRAAGEAAKEFKDMIYAKAKVQDEKALILEVSR
jgi:methyl-accepting chemotaxis protein